MLYYAVHTCCELLFSVVFLTVSNGLHYPVRYWAIMHNLFWLGLTIHLSNLLINAHINFYNQFTESLKILCTKQAIPLKLSKNGETENMSVIVCPCMETWSCKTEEALCLTKGSMDNCQECYFEVNCKQNPTSTQRKQALDKSWFI